VWKGEKYEDEGVILKLDLPENFHIVTIELSGKVKETIVSLLQDNNATEEAREHSEKNWNMMLWGMKKSKDPLDE